jgi:hypothetical protein
MAAVLSNVVNESQSAPTAVTPSIVLSGSIDSPDSSGNVPSGGGGVTLSIVATGIPDGTVVSLSATANDAVTGTATGLPSGLFPALSDGVATLDYQVPADTGADPLTISFQASYTPPTGGVTNPTAAENAAATATRSAEMAAAPAAKGNFQAPVARK